MKRIAIFLCESAWAGSISLTLEIFKTALTFQQRQQQTPAFNVTLIGLGNQAINTFSGIALKPDISLKQATSHYDAVLLPAIWGIDDQYLKQHAPLYPWLRHQHRQGTLLFGLLTGSYLMAEAGLLNGYSATTHWHYAEDFRRRYPDVLLKAEAMQTVENRLYCGGSVNAGMDLSMHLIQQFCGPLIAQQCERHCLMGTRRDYQKLTVDTIASKQHNDSRVLAVQNWLETHYAEPLGLEEITARFGFSQRNLNRRFKAATGKTPQTYIQEYRLEIAKQLLINSQQSIQQICFNIGYESLTVFGRRFKAYTGCSARDFRKEALLTK